MAISGFSPINALPGLAPTSQTMSSLPVASSGLTGVGVVDARAGVAERPGIGSRIVSAMRAAINELRGAPSLAPQSQMLPVQAQRPVTLAKRPAAKPRTARKVRSARTAKTWRTLAHPQRATLPKQQAQPQVQGQLPLSNATMLPGATAYSFDQNGNPVAGGLTPTMLQGLQGLVGGVDREGPQVNATNQNNLSGLFGGVGAGTSAGTAEPVLGAPISSDLIAGSNVAAPAAGTGATQSVTNRNVSDVSSRQSGFGGYGSPWDPSGGVATPWSPYGASMMGSGSSGIGGWFSRLLRS